MIGWSTAVRWPQSIDLIDLVVGDGAKVKGELAWHKHDAEDELFLVLKGSLVIQYEDGEVTLNQGDFHVVPKGRMHNPVAAEECWIALIETVTTRHTGDVVTEKTKPIDQQLADGVALQD